MALTLGEQRVEYYAGVIDGDDGAQHGLAGLGIDLGGDHMGAEREGSARRREHAVDEQSLFDGQLGQLYAGLWVAGYFEGAAFDVELQVARAGFQRGRGS